MMKKVLAPCLSGYSALAIAGFDVVALGDRRRRQRRNLTSYLIRSDNQPRYVALDAGSLLPGIAKGLEKGSFPGDARAGRALHAAGLCVPAVDRQLLYQPRPPTTWRG